jgi:uncharacterized protein (TIGR02594 family)
MRRRLGDCRLGRTSEPGRAAGQGRAAYRGDPFAVLHRAYNPANFLDGVRSIKIKMHRVSSADPSPWWTGGDVVTTARRYIGAGAQFGRRSLWCARFMNYVLEKSGHLGTGSDMASSFARYGAQTGPQVGAIAVMSRRGGGHVGVVSGFDARGNPIVISGNYRNRVAETAYPARRVYAYVLPK